MGIEYVWSSWVPGRMTKSSELMGIGGHVVEVHVNGRYVGEVDVRPMFVDWARANIRQYRAAFRVEPQCIRGWLDGDDSLSDDVIEYATHMYAVQHTTPIVHLVRACTHVSQYITGQSGRNGWAAIDNAAREVRAHARSAAVLRAQLRGDPNVYTPMLARERIARSEQNTSLARLVHAALLPEHQHALLDVDLRVLGDALLEAS